MGTDKDGYKPLKKWDEAVGLVSSANQHRVLNCSAGTYVEIILTNLFVIISEVRPPWAKLGTW